jgi:sugar-specific transcriptional regulator TrmB
MDSSVLQEIGLSKNEIKVYEKLLSIGSSSINRIATESNVHRRNVYDSVEKLISKGLVSEEFISRTRFVSAINPSRLMDIVREKETALEKVLPDLQKKFRSTAEPEKAVLYQGIEGFKNYLNDILEVNEPVYFIGAKAFWLDERLKYFVPKFDKQRIKQGIHFRHIYDFEVRQMSPEILKLRMNEYKFFPKELSSAVAIDLFGDHVVTFYGVSPGKLPEKPVQYTVISSKVAEGYKKYFDFMWKKLGKVKKVN